MCIGVRISKFHPKETKCKMNVPQLFVLANYWVEFKMFHEKNTFVIGCLTMNDITVYNFRTLSKSKNSEQIMLTLKTSIVFRTIENV